MTLFVLLSFMFNLYGKSAIKGVVQSHLNGETLAGANVYLLGTTLGTISDASGYFRLPSIPDGRYILVINFIGYNEQRIPLTLVNRDTTLTIRLSQRPIDGPLVTVEATRARSRLSAVTFSNIDRQRLRAEYTTQDVPELLSELPSTTFYSEGGSGLGYNYLSIRGFGQRRISVMINGIPQNDPEDHNTYWVDFPDLLANVQSIQVQRGAGNAFYGPAAIGGSINILTRYFSPRRKMKLLYGYGSYNTHKFSASFNSGLIKNKFIFFSRISNIKSDGYRQRSWIDFWNYFAGGAFYGARQNLRVQFYGGPIRDGLAYTGLPKFINNNDRLRRKNFSYWRLNATRDSLLDYTDRRKDETERFNQPHLEILHEYKINSHTTLNNNLFYVKGYGYYDYDGSWASPEYFRLTPQYGYDVSQIPTDALIRAYVDNNQVGWLPQLVWRKGIEEIVTGAELRWHRSLHWGRLQKGNGLPAGVTGDRGRRYYQYRGQKIIASLYFHQNHEIYRHLIAMGDIQMAYKQYRLYDEKFLNHDFKVNYLFLNPRIGLNYNFNTSSNLYASISRTTREPRLKNFYDAAEASTPPDWGRVVPQFALNTDGSYNYGKPLVHPETLLGFEAGYSYKGQTLQADLNLYYMDFINEIIKKGGVDRFGQPITGNASRTVHKGVEFSALWHILPRLSLSGNAMYSKNILLRYTVYDRKGDPFHLDGNPISGFPDMLANLRLTYAWKNLYLTLISKFVGKMYTDNYKNEQNTVDPFIVFNLRFRYKLDSLGLHHLALQGRINNILNRRYLAHGEGEAFFPAATINGFFDLQYEW